MNRVRLIDSLLRDSCVSVGNSSERTIFTGD